MPTGTMRPSMFQEACVGFVHIAVLWFGRFQDVEKIFSAKVPSIIAGNMR
jgi:hypothetical protein